MRNALYIAMFVLCMTVAAEAKPAFSVKTALNVPVPQYENSGARLILVAGMPVSEVVGVSLGVGLNSPLTAPLHMAPRVELGASLRLAKWDNTTFALAAGVIYQLNPDYGKGISHTTGPGVGPVLGIGRLKVGVTPGYSWTFAKATSGGWFVQPWASLAF